MIMTADWLTTFPILLTLSNENKTLLRSHSQVVTLPANKTVFAPGMEASNFLMLLTGTVKVHQNSANGREIILYRVGGGETCILTTSCLLSGENYNAEAVTETDVKAVIIPKNIFNQLLALSEDFRTFVFSNYANRIANLIHLVEEVAFERIDTRLVQKLLQLSANTSDIHVTHQQLATELGSAREVISRHLKELERKDWIEVARGKILIKDKNALHSHIRLATS